MATALSCVYNAQQAAELSGGIRQATDVLPWRENFDAIASAVEIQPPNVPRSSP